LNVLENAEALIVPVVGSVRTLENVVNKMAVTGSDPAG